MDVVVYSRDGDPQQVWLIPDNSTDGDSAEVPESASVPGGAGPEASAFAKYKGSSLTWLEWAQQLAQEPWFGSWSIVQLPDSFLDSETPTSAQDALAIIRTQALYRNAGASAPE